MACFSISGRILYALKASFPGWFPKLMGLVPLQQWITPYGRGFDHPKNPRKRTNRRG